MAPIGITTIINQPPFNGDYLERPQGPAGTRNMAKRDTALTNIAAEKAVLGALLRAGSPMPFFQVADMLKADMFSVPLHQLVYGAIRDICEGGKKPSRTLL